VQRDQSALLIIGILYLTSFPVFFYLQRSRKKAEEYRTSYERLKTEAKDVTEAPVFNEENILKRYLEDKEELEGEIKHLLKTLEESIVADSVSFFSYSGGALSCSVSTTESLPECSNDGLLKRVSQQKKPEIYFLDKGKKETSLGYEATDGVQSVILSPVIDHSFCIGVVVAESLRFKAFDERDLKVVQNVSEEIARVIRRQRELTRISINQKGLEMLHEESGRLVQLLELNDIFESILRSVERLSGGKVILIMKDSGRYRIVSSTEERIKPENITLKETVLEIVRSNREPLYLEDVSMFKSKVLPVSVSGIRSLICFPLFHESNIAGFVVVYSENPSAFTMLQFNLLEVFINQASESISRAILHEEMKLRALTDGLTGLYNHRHFQERLEENLKRAERFNESLSLILTDIDHFKSINDTYGHPVGDMVLKTVASTIKSTIREVDIAARYGGEEFAIILIGATSRHARKTAERLRKKIKEKKFSADNKTFTVTISLGVASFPDDSTDREDLIEKADLALYTAKKSGRDRTVLYSEIERINR
jgi:diguanylate cyclase (GGDEF)-like protein